MTLAEMNQMTGLGGNLVQEMHFLMRSKRSSEFLEMEALYRLVLSCDDLHARCECKKCVEVF
ncbi:MAG: hypothetical protein K2X81_26185 [Candidatus Obscuribacterales bacterium]|nr:hypothetical protein [Candidatus Obscuribacterales bacterium]